MTFFATYFLLVDVDGNESLAESYIRHGITAWGGSTHCRILQNTQNQLLKILEKTTTSSTMRIATITH